MKVEDKERLLVKEMLSRGSIIGLTVLNTHIKHIKKQIKGSDNAELYESIMSKISQLIDADKVRLSKIEQQFKLIEKQTDSEQ